MFYLNVETRHPIHFIICAKRTALRWTFAGFLMLLLAYVGSRFVLEVILGRV